MKTLVNKIDLKFFDDDATGEWGLAHATTYNDNNAFNAFWNGMGIFHDVFEHWFENEHKYFMGDNAMNVGGEMAAMGAMWYYYAELGVHNRMNERSFHSPSDSMRMTTESMIQESIQCGYNQFGNTLECGVPYQKPVESGELEYQIQKFADNVKEFNFDYSSNYDQTQEKEDSKFYKESVTSKKITSLHRWGFRMAEKLVPDNYENQDTLIEFYKFWDSFCEQNNAEHLANYFDGITVKLYKEKGVISWTATLIGDGTVKDYKISSNNINYIPDSETIIMESYEMEY